MNGELLATGDPRPHRHDLPEIPAAFTTGVNGGQVAWKQVNAVARCGTCGRLFVSREDPDGWGRVVYWARLRWWHRKAWAKLRVEEARRIEEVARRIGGVAP